MLFSDKTQNGHISAWLSYNNLYSGIMFTLKKVLKVLKRKSRTTRGRVEFLNNLDYYLTGLNLDVLRKHRDGHMYASDRDTMFKIIDKLSLMIKNSIKQRESKQLKFSFNGSM